MTDSRPAFGGSVQDPRTMPRERALADLSRRVIAFTILSGWGAMVWIAPQLLPAEVTATVADVVWTLHVGGPVVSVIAGLFGAIHAARYARVRVAPPDRTPVRADGGRAVAVASRPRRLSASVVAAGLAALALWSESVVPAGPGASPVFVVVKPLLGMVVIACILFVGTLIATTVREHTHDTGTDEQGEALHHGDDTRQRGGSEDV
jgi:hypothetical protein